MRIEKHRIYDISFEVPAAQRIIDADALIEALATAVEQAEADPPMPEWFAGRPRDGAHE